MQKLALPLIIVLAVGAMIGIFITGGGSSQTPAHAASVRQSPNGLPGLLISPAPWSNNTDQLGDRLIAVGLPQLSSEGTVLHIHQHLAIFVNGQKVSVPAEIGIPSSQAFISPIHTHDTSGIIHVESPTQQNFYLGQFFDIWGVKFDANDLGGYITDSTNSLNVYVNGSKVSGDPRKLVLAQHQEIVVAYGASQQIPSLPSSYSFPAGY